MHLSTEQTQVLVAAFERLFPTAEDEPGVVEMGAVDYVARVLDDGDEELAGLYRSGLDALDAAGFVDCQGAEQDALLSTLERDQPAFFDQLLAHLQEGLFGDPLYGGNTDKQGWRWLRHPGVWLENSSDENFDPAHADKQGRVQSIEDVLPEIRRAAPPPSIEAGAGDEEVDVVIVGVGAVGGLLVRLLTERGLRVVGLEAGGWFAPDELLPDEIASYYCRGSLGPKFMSEVPHWRKSAEQTETEPIGFALGRMVNGVGGSAVHYGAWMRRFHPHHFRVRSRLLERYGPDAIPATSTVIDWPFGYEDLEPYYDQVERTVGVSGNDANPFVPRTRPHPMPPLREFPLGQRFTAAAEQLGLHPHPIPAGINSVPYDGRPATDYTAFSSGFGSPFGDKWDPSQTAVPAALATGLLDLRLHCRVTKVLVDEASGRATGVEYVDADGATQVQRGKAVILATYTWENLRLLFLSGLGNGHGQLGKHFMSREYGRVLGHFPDTIFNRHAGPAGQAMAIDDFSSDGFDALPHGFVGGATFSTENQLLPLQIAREPLPPDVPRWGSKYAAHLREWQHIVSLEFQPDMLPHVHNYVELDPTHTDSSPLRLPVLRATFDLGPNELRLAEYMEDRAEEILREMGATRVWRGARYTGLGSSHELGGTRMGTDPRTSVVSPDLEVHDTPGLYVFGGSTFPSCAGINPTLTIWAVSWRAAERLADRFTR